ncbi:CDP-diacylglycerol--glycerol-3-phosphate 3-phosphatidyltransferase [bacterium HR40]|nr:CDP-diacylglycerol--glycerol-3-phosphate 3-phosphatidyltransferase [bacterium HR40]
MFNTTPNLLTVSRVLLVPLIVAILHVDQVWARYLACALFVAAATTDYVDGLLARSWKMQSPFGRWLDPVADKLLVAATVVVLVGFDRAPLLPAIVIVLREITVSGLREYMAEVAVGLPVSRLAKWKTAVQMTAIGFLIVGESGPAWLPVQAIGWWGLWVAALLTLITGWDYLRAGLAHMLERPPRVQPDAARSFGPSP